ncbi:MAG: SagB/ThcOx family dehydrogenase [Verrucomicrobia bacterium]|nr:SagB/ThcOx family dehydrogenase [Verrucomicrobiota bacterium]
MAAPLQQIFGYHEATKHHFHRYARALGYLDWATQPNPFRRYSGVPLIRLKKIPPAPEPLYDCGFLPGYVAPAPLDFESISQLFYDSLALSAWKSIQTAIWSLRVNPSSGNLHPTEGYLICGPLRGIGDAPMVCHYTPEEHALEVRAEFPLSTWRDLTRDLPPGAILVGLTSIHWREAWKYGERGYRYCQHDAGHAIAALSIAAAGLGWQAGLLEELGTEQVSHLLGVFDPQGVEPEQPDCLLAVCPQGEEIKTQGLNSGAINSFTALSWQGKPNQLSPSHVDWSIIDEVTQAARKPPTGAIFETLPSLPAPLPRPWREISLRQMIRQRRSAVAMDGVTTMSSSTFCQMLLKTLARPGAVPFSTLPWRPHIHLAIFVHRVAGLPPGLYFVVRDEPQKGVLQAALRQDALWEKPASCPEALPLYQLLEADTREASRQISCHQDIASDGCFSLGMLAEFEAPLREHGPWFYPRLFWEAGMIGQVLYLEAEAAGIRSTGIGCYFDDPMHEVLGLPDRRYQDLYHFTVGGHVEDRRLTTLPAYPDEATAETL